MADNTRLRELRDEATNRFAGSGGVIGVAIGAGTHLTVLLAHPDIVREGIIRAWAQERGVLVDFVVSGRFHAGFVA
jgi:hypothetical protein